METEVGSLLPLTESFSVNVLNSLMSSCVHNSTTCKKMAATVFNAAKQCFVDKRKRKKKKLYLEKAAFFVGFYSSNPSCHFFVNLHNTVLYLCSKKKSFLLNMYVIFNFHMFFLNFGEYQFQKQKPTDSTA